MKKFLLLTVLVAVLGLPSLFAQGYSQASDYYYYNVTIEKVFAYKLGYIVVYRKGLHQMARTYLPQEWFASAGGKGDVIYLSHGTEWPSLTVYYKEGEFSHVRLKVRRERNHETWGMVPRTANIDDFFQGIEEVKLEF